ncbi:N-acetylneuraminate synthase family protein [uncultured Roseivirga sp.]|uniref:N-acetylneuraminate synthase family protein n=1 Tax=uncultured Roseivirga sp. TaxID=543088 RepID=UPI000D7B137E|nr:N-acetylneuraminate synthase family protein [uncultured Roseivirga sp.]PWL30929.1 MAG: N-acetylneuraminate synthase [Roseivirga sp. XM-24bin3]
MSRYLIAEIGGNHEGDFEVAKDLLYQACESPVDCVKFQVYTGDSLVNSRLSPDRNKHFKRFELSIDQYLQLAEICEGKGKDFNASIWSHELIKEFEKYLNFIKIGSGDLTHYYLLEKVAELQIPIIVSTGLSHAYEVDDVVSFIEGCDPYYKERDHICVMQCTSMYPIPFSDANLAVLDSYKKLKHRIGYSDHTEGFTALKFAYAKGADVLEFHFSSPELKAERTFRDHKVSLVADEVRALAADLDEIDDLLGSSVKAPCEIEITTDHVTTFRRGVFLMKNLSKGHILTLDDLVFLRPAIGIPANEFSKLIGRKLKRDVLSLETLSFDMFE